jgi:phosphoribosylanthranilate isomerase
VPGCEVFKAVTLSNSGETSLNLPQGADRFIFDGARPGSGEEFDWGLIRKYTGETPFLLAGGIGPHNVQQVRELIRENYLCVGVDINSRVELRVGVKDEQAVRAVLKGVRV